MATAFSCARVTGFEPAISAVTGQRFKPLSYTRNVPRVRFADYIRLGDFRYRFAIQRKSFLISTETKQFVSSLARVPRVRFADYIRLGDFRYRFAIQRKSFLISTETKQFVSSLARVPRVRFELTTSGL